MNLRTKTLGLIAATALSISLAGGAVAADSDVKLSPNSTASGCAITAGQTLDADFGEYEFDGSVYQPAPGAGTVNLVIAMTQDIEPTHDCDITVESTVPLTSGTDTISNGSITATAVSPGSGTGTLASAQTLTYPVPAATGIDAGVTLALATPGSTQPTGDYSGTITFTAGDGL